MTAAIIMGILTLMLITGTPISIALGMTVLVFLLAFSSFDMQTVNIISQRLFTGLESFAIMAVPFFVLAGAFLTDGGVALRGLFLINPEGNVEYQVVHNLGVGRSVDETLRVLEAFQYVAKNGEVCPANWKKGSDTMKPDPKGSQEYFKKQK